MNLGPRASFTPEDPAVADVAAAQRMQRSVNERCKHLVGLRPPRRSLRPYRHQRARALHRTQGRDVPHPSREAIPSDGRIPTPSRGLSSVAQCVVDHFHPQGVRKADCAVSGLSWP
jgi:hypothetical protein